MKGGIEMQSKQERKNNLKLIEKLKSDAKRLQEELKQQQKNTKNNEEARKQKEIEREMKLQARKGELQKIMQDKEELVGTSFSLEDVVALMSNSDNIQQSIDLAYCKEANERFYVKAMERAYKCSLVKIGQEYIVEHIENPTFCSEAEEVEIFSPGQYSILQVIGIENFVRFNTRLGSYVPQVCDRIALKFNMQWKQMENEKILFFK